MRWLGFTLLAAGCVAAACWGPAQLWPTTAAPDGVYGRAGDGPSGLALLSAQAEKGALQADVPPPASAANPPSPASPPVTAVAEPFVPEVAEAACTTLLPRLPGLSRAQCVATRLQASGALSRQGAPQYWRDVQPHASVASKGERAAEPLRVLVVGAMHGDELTAASLALRWIGMAAAEGAVDAGEPAPVHWRFIPVLNPDGLLAPKPTRVNAGGVDLNRNFPTPGWAEEAPVYWEKRTRKDPRRWPGHTPLSEPESRFLHQQMDQFQPQLVVSIHAPYGVLDFDGPHDPPLRLGRLRMDKLGVFPGSLGHYGGLHRGVPVVTIELEHALRMPPDAEVRAMWRDLRHWMNTRLLEGADAVAGVKPPGLRR